MSNVIAAVAERVAKREEHPARTQQRGLDVGVRAPCHPRQELVDAEGLGVGLRLDPWRQLGRQLPRLVITSALRPVRQQLDRYGITGAVS